MSLNAKCQSWCNLIFNIKCSSRNRHFHFEIFETFKAFRWIRIDGIIPDMSGNLANMDQMLLPIDSAKQHISNTRTGSKLDWRDLRKVTKYNYRTSMIEVVIIQKQRCWYPLPITLSFGCRRKGSNVRTSDRIFRPSYT